MFPWAPVNGSTIQTGSFFERKRETAEEIITASDIQQTCRPQVGGTKAELPKISAQTSWGSIADAQALDHGRGVYATLPQVDQRFGGMRQLLLIERVSRLQQPGRIGSRLDAAQRGTLQPLPQLRQASPAAASMAVEDLLAAVDVKRRMGLAVQRTESGDFLPAIIAGRLPTVCDEVIE